MSSHEQLFNNDSIVGTPNCNFLYLARYFAETTDNLPKDKYFPELVIFPFSESFPVSILKIFEKLSHSKNCRFDELSHLVNRRFGELS